MNNPNTRRVTQLLALAVMLLGFAAVSQGAIIGTEEMVTSDARAADLATVEQALAREDVKQQLTRMGVDPDAAAARAASLSDAELAGLAGDLENVPAGQGAIEVLGVVFLVLLVLELTGVINIFN